MRVLFVCLGNICRSPMAEGVFREITRSRELEVVVDSAGTGGWHIGEPPDARGQAKLRTEGIDISSQRARQFEQNDFERFDFILAMDRQNHTNLMRLANGSDCNKVLLFARFISDPDIEDIPDPYYGGKDGFDLVFDLIREAGNGLADFIQDKR